MVRYETYNYLDYEEYKYLEDKTNSEMYPSSNKREFDTLLRKNIRWYLDSTIKDDEKRIELFDKFINVNMNIDVRKTEFILNQVYKLLTFLKFINYSLTEYDTERLYKKNYISALDSLKTRIKELGTEQRITKELAKQALVDDSDANNAAATFVLANNNSPS